MILIPDIRADLAALVRALPAEQLLDLLRRRMHARRFPRGERRDRLVQRWRLRRWARKRRVFLYTAERRESRQARALLRRRANESAVLVWAQHEASASLPVSEPLTRNQHRSRRRREVGASSINMNRLAKRDVEIGRSLYPETDYWKPRRRSECADAPRPCPFVSCHYHLFLDVSGIGSIKLNFPDLEPDELTESCVLDVADRGGTLLEDVGGLMNLTRERVRQLEVRALAKIEKRAPRFGLDAFDEPGLRRVRRLPILQESP